MLRTVIILIVSIAFLSAISVQGVRKDLQHQSTEKILLMKQYISQNIKFQDETTKECKLLFENFDSPVKTATKLRNHALFNSDPPKHLVDEIHHLMQASQENLPKIARKTVEGCLMNLSLSLNRLSCLFSGSLIGVFFQIAARSAACTKDVNDYMLKGLINCELSKIMLSYINFESLSKQMLKTIKKKYGRLTNQTYQNIKISFLDYKNTSEPFADSIPSLSNLNPFYRSIYSRASNDIFKDLERCLKEKFERETFNTLPSESTTVESDAENDMRKRIKPNEDHNSVLKTGSTPIPSLALPARR